MKYLVTSGCSFTDNIYTDKRWPHYLAAKLDRKLINYGLGSAGNDYICNSTIFAISNLLNKNIDPCDIKVVVMWSGLDRFGLFISRKENDFNDLVNHNGQPNPVNFINMHENLGSGLFAPNDYKDINSGWLLGSPSCSFNNIEIVKLKQLYLKYFYNREDFIFKSFNYFLQLQWFCKSKNIKLFNLTYQQILDNNQKTEFESISHLWDLVDWSQWIFWKDHLGLYEYSKDNGLTFYLDKFHPLPESHKYFVDNFLSEKIRD